MHEARDGYTRKLAMADEARKSPFIRELCAFLSAIEDDEAAIYDAASWRARGEEYGNETSVVWTITSEGGPLYYAFNPGYAVGSDGIAWANRIEGMFTKFLERHGLWYTLGYAWTVHLIDDAAMARPAMSAIDPQHFIAEMRAKCEDYRNVLSLPLLATSGQIVETINQQIEDPRKPGLSSLRNLAPGRRPRQSYRRFGAEQTSRKIRARSSAPVRSPARSFSTNLASSAGAAWAISAL